MYVSHLQLPPTVLRGKSAPQLIDDFDISRSRSLLKPRGCDILWSCRMVEMKTSSWFWTATSSLPLTEMRRCLCRRCRRRVFSGLRPHLRYDVSRMVWFGGACSCKRGGRVLLLICIWYPNLLMVRPSEHFFILDIGPRRPVAPLKYER